MSVDLGDARRGATIVLGLAVALAPVNVARIATVGSVEDTLVGGLVVALLLPLHVHHMRFGLRGERPPLGRVTLAVMALVEIAGLAVIAAPASFTLPLLAVSALIVLPSGPALAVAAACCLAPAVLGYDIGADGGPLYLVFSVALRIVVQAVLVWLVASVHQLAWARAALVEQTIEEERLAMGERIDTAVDRRLAGVRDATLVARAELRAGEVGAPLLALDWALNLARAALDDLRRVVAAPQRRRPEAAPPQTTAATATARWLAVAVCASTVVFVLFAFLAGKGYPRPDPMAVTLVALGVVVALFAVAALHAAAGRPVPHGTHVALASLAVAAAAHPIVGRVWFVGWWFVIATWALALPRRPWTLAAALALVVAVDLIPGLPADVGVLGPVGTTVYLVAYDVSVVVLYTFALIASPRLVAIVDELERTRAPLVAEAGLDERRRLARDLHDVLGQSLTRLTNKADLVRRLVPADRARAATELDEVIDLLDRHDDEVDAVTRGRRETSFAAELEHATELLRTAGVAVHPVVGPAALDPRTDRLLGYVMREAATNVVRHADATRADVRLDADGGAVTVTIANDGARGPRGDTGTGLANIAHRVRRAEGSFDARVADGWHRLVVTVPGTNVTNRADGADRVSS